MPKEKDKKPRDQADDSGDLDREVLDVMQDEKRKAGVPWMPQPNERKRD